MRRTTAVSGSGDGCCSGTGWCCHQWPGHEISRCETRDLLAGENYLKLLFLGLPGCLLGFTANGVLSAQGDMSANRTAQIVAFGANVLLDPLLIYGAFGIPGLGFDGIAISTALIQSCVAIWLVRKALGTRALSGVCIRDFLPGRQIAFALFRQGAPSSLTMMVMMFGGLIMQAHLQPFGAPAVAGAGISLRVEQLIFCRSGDLLFLWANGGAEFRGRGL